MTKRELAEKAGVQERQIEYNVQFLKPETDYYYKRSGAKNTRRIHFTDTGIAKVLNRPNARKKAKDTTM
jgi:hypothetical protein